MVTPISTVLITATVHCDLVYGGYRCGMGVVYHVLYKTVKQSWQIFCHGH